MDGHGKMTGKGTNLEDCASEWTRQMRKCLLWCVELQAHESKFDVQQSKDKVKLMLCFVTLVDFLLFCSLLRAQILILLHAVDNSRDR